MAGLVLEAVRKAYGAVLVLDDIDLDVRDGEFVVFVGPSGCGKSTLLRLIAGLDQPSGGRIRIDGGDVTGLAPADRGIAMVFQSYALYPHMNVAQNLAFGLENLSMPRAEIEDRVAEAARMLAIEGLLARKPRQLSGGQRQRVAIGRAIVRDPKIFLFDEPLSNLDAALRVQTRAEISALHRRLQTTMIYVTHDQIEAMTMADRIAVLNGGRVEQFGAPMELFERPANRFVAGFIGSPRMNFYPGTLVARTTAGATVSVPGLGTQELSVDAGALEPGAPIELGIRPGHFSTEPHDGARPATLIVDRRESIGTETYLYGRMAGNDVPTVVHAQGNLVVPEGQDLPVGVRPRDLHVFAAETGAVLPPL